MIHKPLSFRDQSHRWCVRNGTEHPRHVTGDIRDHEHVVRVVMVGRGDVDPSTTKQGSGDTDNEKDKGPRRLAGSALQIILKKYEGKARPRGQGDEDLEEASLRIPVTNTSQKRS